MSDEKQIDGIDESDISQDSPAEAEAEVTDPDGTDEQDEADGIDVAPIGQTGIVTGGTGLGRP